MMYESGRSWDRVPGNVGVWSTVRGGENDRSGKRIRQVTGWDG